MKKIFFFLFLALLSCQTARKADTSITKIIHGSSFGHCRGYCTHETIIDSQGVLLKSSSRDANNPDQLTSVTLTAGEWKAMTNAFDLKAVEALPETIGCPDCADGGAEWFEIQTGTTVKRVTFEFGNIPAEFTKLAELVSRKEVKE